MLTNNWTAEAIYRLYKSETQIRTNIDLTILQHDIDNEIVIGYTKNGFIFLGSKQISDIPGFKSNRARLDVLQEIDSADLGLIKPAFVLSFLVNNDEELASISAIFSGLYDFNKNHKGTSKATEAAQGFQGYLSKFPKIILSKEIEIGLFGELSLIASGKENSKMVMGWHSNSNSTFDFSFGGFRLEVKTSIRPTRIHWLRSTQSLNEPEENLFYVSIYAPEDASGIGLLDLVSKIKLTLDDTTQGLLDEKLSFYDLTESKTKFDFAQTIKSLKFFEASNIPRPKFDSEKILEVQWKCNFNELQPTSNYNPWIEIINS
jgi:hypothetical protein